jgi:hypothetical protein
MRRPDNPGKIALIHGHSVQAIFINGSNRDNMLQKQRIVDGGVP